MRYDVPILSALAPEKNPLMLELQPQQVGPVTPGDMLNDDVLVVVVPFNV